NDYMVASDIVRYLRLSPVDAAGKGDFTLSTLSKEQLADLATKLQTQQALERQASLAKLPDVIMTVASLPGVLVQSLLDTGEYRLASFENVEPFLSSQLSHSDTAEGSVDRILLEPTVIHTGMYLGDAVVPAHDCHTIGLRTLLVARVDLPE